MPGLRRPGRVLLVSCYENGHVPHGIAMPAGFLRRAGYEPAVADLAVHRLEDEVIDRARVAVISVPMHTAMRLGLRVAERIRSRNPACTIAFAGLYAAMNRNYLQDRGDWILAGEYEDELLEHLTRLEAAQPAEHGAAPALRKLTFPAPSRTGLPGLDRYAKLAVGGHERLTGYTETTRGCRDMCAHCPVPAVYRGRLFAVPRQVVLDDIEAQVEQGAAHITFGDPDFLNGPQHGLQILRELHRRWPTLSFDITAQVTHLFEQSAHLAEIAALGCAFVVTAVESVSDVVLERLSKRHRRADVERLLALSRDAGLVLRPTFVPFTPWSTRRGIGELFEFIAAHQLVHHVSPIQLTIRLLVPPGSLLLESEATRSAFGPLDAAALTHRWVHADPAMDALQAALTQCASVAAQDQRSDADAYADMRAIVWDAIGAPPPPAVALQEPAGDVPRLTEPWFC